MTETAEAPAKAATAAHDTADTADKAPKTPTICLCMIVRNEAAVIERCLTSVRPLITTWSISDTGSTDGTQRLVRETLADIPGELHEDPWIDFGHNRSRNIRRARGQADYLLLIDADMVLNQEAELPPLAADAYLIRHAGAVSYRNLRLVRGNLPWRYQGSTHEYLTSETPFTAAHLDALVVEHHADGGSRQDKFERDARLLAAELDREPDNPRVVFYLAQTMRDLGRTAEAIELYERRAAMGGWEEELYFARLQAGVLLAESGDWPAAMAWLVRAWEGRPQRLEAVHELASRLRAKGDYHTAHAFAAAGLDRPIPPDWLFVTPWVYRWGLLFEYSITSYWVGDQAASRRACDRLLQMPDLPDAHRRQTLANREFSAS